MTNNREQRTYELYDSALEEVADVVQMTEEEASNANDELRRDGSYCRYIQSKDSPRHDCSCGAEYAFECVCNFETVDLNHIEEGGSNE